MCGIRSVGSAQRRPARPSELLSATATVLARDSLCVHHVRELLAAHGIAPTGPRGRPDLLVLVADDAADLLALAPARAPAAAGRET